MTVGERSSRYTSFIELARLRRVGRGLKGPSAAGEPPAVTEGTMITICEYDSNWPVLFEEEAHRLHVAFGSTAQRIEHVGSTSVPALAARPIIDIQVSVTSLRPHDRYIELMAALGYRHVALGDFDLVYPWFHKPAEWPSTHHVHLCNAGGEQEWKHLAFRDYLRAHPSVAREYEALKSELALGHDGDTVKSSEAYSLAKSGFVANVLRAAMAGT